MLNKLSHPRRLVIDAFQSKCRSSSKNSSSESMSSSIHTSLRVQEATLNVSCAGNEHIPVVLPNRIGAGTPN